jgi:hypothetical protein
MPAVSENTVPARPRAAAPPSAPAQTEAELLPATDTLWADVYHVIALLREADGVQWWKAHRTDTAEEVVLRVAPGAKGDARAEVWERLAALELPHLQRAREVLFVAGHRVEVSDALRGTPLDAWRAARASVEEAALEAVVRQLAEALGVLHASGLVHTGLRPGVIFVREESGGLHCTLGGLESAVRFEGGPVALPVDPFYAPPEAAGLDRQEGGTALCAWDWWGLGRVVQELILGRPIAALLPETQPGETLAARAEALLWERDPAGARAGAVELMPPLEARLQTLLRGLLASAPEVRWNGDFLDRWLRRLPTKEGYGVRRLDRRFRWRGKLWEVPAAAGELRSAALWPEAARHVFERDTPGTLAHFLARSPDHQLQREQLEETLKLADAEPLRGGLPEVAREVVVTVALAQLAESGPVWRGRRLDGASLGAVLAEEAGGLDRLAFVRALTHRNITAAIERQDFRTARSLADAGRVADDAEAWLKRHGWLKSPDAEESARIFRLSLETDARLRELGVDALRRDYACSSQPAVDKAFQGAQPARAELVAFAWVAPRAAECGFVTHAAWQTQRAGELRARASGLLTALAWARLGRALGAGPVVFGAWPGFIAAWVAVAVAVAAVSPGAQWLPLALLPGALALALRFFGAAAGGATLRRCAPAAAPWRWRDGAARCERELRALNESRDAAGLENALAEIEGEIAKLTLAKPAPGGAPPEFGGVRACGLAGWLVLTVSLALCGWRGATHRPSSLGAAWFRAIAAAEQSAAPSAAAAPAKASDIKVSWPYRPGRAEDAQVFHVVATRPATRTEKSDILALGRRLVAPYRPETISTLLIFRVTAGDRAEVAIFDGQRGGPVNDNLYTLEFPPLARTWIEVAGRRGIFLDP